MTLASRVAASLFAAAAASVLAGAAFCSWAIAEGASPRWRLAFRLLCHGIESRCLTLWGVAMPICARCTAIYAGLVAGIALFAIVPWLRRRSIPTFVLALAVAPLAIDGVTQAIGFRESTNDIRVMTGLLAASVFAIWAMAQIEQGALRSESGTFP